MVKKAINRDSILWQMVAPLRNGLRSYYFDIATNVFKWENMPKAIPKRIPEKYLYDSGMCVFFQPDGLDYMCLPVTQRSIQKNVYGEPSSWSPMAIGELAGFINSIKLDATNSVLIRNDYAYSASKTYIDSMIDQLINVELTTRMNINAQKMPLMFKGSEQTVLENKNTFLEFMECEPVFFKNKYANDEFEIFQSGAPFIANELCKTYVEYDSRILTYLGINNLPVEKGERMLVDEIGVNKEEKNLILDARLNQRKNSVEEINKIFNLDISVAVSESLSQGGINDGTRNEISMSRPQ